MRRTVLLALCMLIIGTQIVGCSSFDTRVKGNELSYVMDKLELGMSKTEVKERFGRSYTNVDDEFDGHEMWRFDSVSEKGYIVVQETDHKVTVPYDRSGLLSGKLISQLFIGWTDDNLVRDVTVYYIEDGEIRIYYILSSGQTGELSV